MPNAVTISGLDDCLRCFDAAPANLVRISRTALRDASKKTSRQIRQKTPQRFRRLVKYKVFKGRVSGDLGALVGLFNRKQTTNGSGQVEDWFKAYWKNYGTITRRDQSHHFQQAVKRNVRNRRNNVGQHHENFFERAVAGWEGPFLEAFQNSLKEQEYKLYDR